MTEIRNGSGIERRGLSWRHALPAATLLVLAACAGDGGGTEPTQERERAVFTFDDLGGDPETILVYRGPGESEADRQVVSDEYDDGDEAFIDCVVPEGREVPSDPSVGEREATSHVWFRLGAPEYPFATDTYGDADTPIDDITECDADLLVTEPSEVATG